MRRPQRYRKGKAAKPNEFGKMVKLQVAESLNRWRYEVTIPSQRRRASDLAIETHQARLGRAPILWPRMRPSIPQERGGFEGKDMQRVA